MRPNKTAKSYIVTTSVRGNTHSQVWNGTTPLAIGHPLHWVIEQTKEGVRVRNISARLHEVQSNAFHELAREIIEKGTDIKLDAKAGVSLNIRPVTELAPAFASVSGSTLNVLTCAGKWIMNSTTLAKTMKTPAFTLKQTGDGYAITFQTDGASVLDPSPRTAKSGETLTLTPSQIVKTQIKFGPHTWHFSLTDTPDLPATNKTRIDQDLIRFKQSLLYAFLGLGAFALLAWLWPKPQEAELIPPQFAKIVLSQPQKPAAPAGEEAGKIESAKKVQDAAVVQAFRAKALQNSINGLLKGGMTRLLAQSEFVQGTQASKDARRIFDTKSNSLRATGPDIGNLNDKNVKVAAIGGDAKGVGYGKGERAGVKGQGSSMVSFDIGGSSVQEGLTKDEVGEVIHRHLSEVRYCYEAAMLRTPGIEGKLIVNFTIGGPGNVKSSEVKTSTLPDPRLDDCILRRLVTWKFPQTKGGVDVAVSYPFIFKTLGR